MFMGFELGFSFHGDELGDSWILQDLCNAVNGV